MDGQLISCSVVPDQVGDRDLYQTLQNEGVSQEQALSLSRDSVQYLPMIKNNHNLMKFCKLCGKGHSPAMNPRRFQLLSEEKKRARSKKDNTCATVHVDRWRGSLAISGWSMVLRKWKSRGWTLNVPLAPNEANPIEQEQAEDFDFNDLCQSIPQLCLGPTFDLPLRPAPTAGEAHRPGPSPDTLQGLVSTEVVRPPDEDVHTIWPPATDITHLVRRPDGPPPYSANDETDTFAEIQKLLTDNARIMRSGRRLNRRSRSPATMRTGRGGKVSNRVLTRREHAEMRSATGAAQALTKGARKRARKAKRREREMVESTTGNAMEDGLQARRNRRDKRVLTKKQRRELRDRADGEYLDKLKAERQVADVSMEEGSDHLPGTESAGARPEILEGVRRSQMQHQIKLLESRRLEEVIGRFDGLGQMVSMETE